LRDKRVELKGYFLSKSTLWESWTIALNQTELGQKAARQTNTADDDDDDDE
jgi:hypothetical protein